MPACGTHTCLIAGALLALAPERALAQLPTLTEQASGVGVTLGMDTTNIIKEGRDEGPASHGRVLSSNKKKGGATDSTGLNRCGKACRVPSSRKTIGKPELPISSLLTLPNL